MTAMTSECTTSLIDGNAALVLPGDGVLVLAGQPDAHWSLAVR
ncbi:hypothetical protein [Kerstersia gyiorum]|jgi:hypothetical protein|nr:hypothetical protein [Kerstersia gyiorum]